MTDHWGQLAITMLASVLLFSPLLLWTYQLGRRSKSSGKSERFDRVVADLFLNNTQWHAVFDADDVNVLPHQVTLHLRQSGARVFGEAHAVNGAVHSFEGLLHGRQLCYVSLDDDMRIEWPGAVLAEVMPGEQQMIGIRSRWSESQKVLLLRNARFTRIS